MNLDIQANKAECAKLLGFNTASEAMYMLGVDVFKKEWNNYRVGRNIVEQVPVSFNNKYQIYSDGRCYSLWSESFLAKIPIKDNGKIYECYCIRLDDNPKKKHTIAKLVYYHFGLHNFKSYKDFRGNVVHIDGDISNNHITNLVLMDRSRMNKFYGIRPDKNKCTESLSKIKSDQIEIIKKHRATGLSKKAISQIYKVSEMSVFRFC